MSPPLTTSNQSFNMEPWSVRRSPFPFEENAKTKIDYEIEHQLSRGPISANQSLEFVNIKLKDLRTSAGSSNQPSYRQQHVLQSMVNAMSPSMTHSMIQQNLVAEKKKNKARFVSANNHLNMHDEIASLENCYKGSGLKFEPKSLDRKTFKDSQCLKNNELGFSVANHMSQLGRHVIGELNLPKNLKMDAIS